MTTKPATSETKEPIITKDRWEIICLITFKHVPEQVERIRSDNGQMVSMFHFTGEAAHKLYQDYKHGLPLPVPDIRDVERAEKIFKGFIRE